MADPGGHNPGDLVEQSSWIAEDAKEVRASAQAGGFGFEPAAADALISVLRDAVRRIADSAKSTEELSRKPLLGRTPGAQVVAPFTREVAVDDRGIVRALSNVQEMLEELIIAYGYAKSNYLELESLTAENFRQIDHANATGMMGG